MHPFSYQVDAINMSYGEATSVSNRGRFVSLINERCNDM